MTTITYLTIVQMYVISQWLKLLLGSLSVVTTSEHRWNLLLINNLVLNNDAITFLARLYLHIAWFLNLFIVVQIQVSN